METSQFYLASKDVAQRTGFIKHRYVTKEGKYIISARDLRNVKQTDDEQKNGLDVVPITSEDAKRMIAENKYKMG